ncbi:MAG: hypothetical protein M0Q02_10360 [Candidatus Muirbacterium halophilum]|nr:hypothetical protein [Candidatus Muirbacterium halophilum]
MKKDNLIFFIIFLTGISFIILGSLFAKANFLYAVDNRIELNQKLIKDEIKEKFQYDFPEDIIYKMNFSDILIKIKKNKDFSKYKDEVLENIKIFNNEIKELNRIIEKFPNNIVCDIMKISKKKEIEFSK